MNHKVQDLFLDYQKELRRLANNRFGRVLLGIPKNESKVLGLGQNGYFVKAEGKKVKGVFRGYPLFAKKLRYALSAIDIIKNPPIKQDTYSGLPAYQGLLNYVGLTSDRRFPQVMLDEDSFFSDTGDGQLMRLNDGTNFNTTRNAAAALTVDDTGTNFEIQAQLAGGKVYLRRASLPFVTSDLGAGAIITVGDLTLTAQAIYTEGGSPLMGLVQTNVADPENIVVGDWDEIGESAGSGWSNAAQTDIIEGATRLDATATAGTQRTFSLDSTGMSWIDPEGWALFGVRNHFDLDNVAINGNKVDAAWRTSDYAGTSSDPLLEVTFTPLTASTNYLKNYRAVGGRLSFEE